MNEQNDTSCVNEDYRECLKCEEYHCSDDECEFCTEHECDQIVHCRDCDEELNVNNYENYMPNINYDEQVHIEDGHSYGEIEFLCHDCYLKQEVDLTADPEDYILNENKY